jgi:hypothetical protein
LLQERERHGEYHHKGEFMNYDNIFLIFRDFLKNI